MAKEHYSSRYFCSPLLLTSKQTLRLGQLIEDHMAKEHYYIRLLFTSFAHFEANVATRSADRRSHGKGTLLIRLLFTSFAHFEANVATRSADRRSHGKGTFRIKILLFTSFAHFEANVATRSADRRSHGKGTLATSSKIPIKNFFDILIRCL